MHAYLGIVTEIPNLIFVNHNNQLSVFLFKKRKTIKKEKAIKKESNAGERGSAERVKGGWARSLGRGALPSLLWGLRKTARLRRVREDRV